MYISRQLISNPNEFLNASYPSNTYSYMDILQDMTIFYSFLQKTRVRYPYL